MTYAMEGATAEILEFLRQTVERDEIVELRILDAVDLSDSPAKFVVSGCFDSDHWPDLADEALQWTRHAAGVYTTINAPLPALLARAANQVVVRAKVTTRDAEIARRCTILVDADPVRPAKISASTQEKAAAWEAIQAVIGYLRDRGWPEPIVIDSGNGFHARYVVDLPNDEPSRQLVERVLKVISARFSDDDVTIDTTTFNASRIAKLPGTWARKGEPTDERPHRRSRVVSVPDVRQVVPRELLEALAAEYEPAAAEPRQKESPRQDDTQSEEGETPTGRVIAKLREQGFAPRSCGPKRWKSRCPSHRGRRHNLSVAVGDDGRVLLYCHHKSEGVQQCTPVAIAKALGLTEADLSPPRHESAQDKGQATGQKAQGKPGPDPAGNGRVFHTLRDAVMAIGLGEPTAHWVYRGLDGEEVMRVYRFDPPSGKEYRPITPNLNGAGWIVRGLSSNRPLYRLDELVDAETVFVCEGEKCADRVCDLGLVATTSAHGAKGAAKTDWGPLAGKTVFLVPDNDEEGEGYIHSVGAILAKLDPRPTVKVLRLDVPPKGDVDDWLEALPESMDDLASAEALERLAATAAEWTAPDELSWVEIDYAMLVDAERKIGESRYLWDLWILRGALTGLFGPPGTGKTRIAADLAKRLWFGLPMPDKSKNSVPPGTKTLWLLYDRNYLGLIRTLKSFGMPLESVLLPTHRNEPLVLPDFDKPETMRILERFIKIHKPGLVVIDSATYASAYNSGKPNEAKIAYDPILDLLARTMQAALPLTHTNANGTPLNRRISERCRLEIKISAPDPEDPGNLRLEVNKTDDKKPPALGLIHRDDGVEYSFTPPEAPAAPGRGRKATTSPGVAEFIWDYLQNGEGVPVVQIIDAARDKEVIPPPTAENARRGISNLYDAMRKFLPRFHPGWKVLEYEVETPRGKSLKHWRLVRVDAAEGHGEEATENPSATPF
jgi:hypothetical protein